MNPSCFGKFKNESLYCKSHCNYSQECAKEGKIEIQDKPGVAARLMRRGMLNREYERAKIRQDWDRVRDIDREIKSLNGQFQI